MDVAPQTAIARLAAAHKKELKPSGCGLLIFLSAAMDHDGWLAEASTAEIARCTDSTERTTRSAIKRLEALGLVQRWRANGKASDWLVNLPLIQRMAEQGGQS